MWPAIYSMRMATTLLDATPMAPKPTCDAGCHVTPGRERLSGYDVHSLIQY